MRIGTVTIGQAPRVDVVPEIQEIMGPAVEVVEAGALDGLTKEEIAAFAPGPGDYVLVTRLADGTSVQVAEKYITPRIIAAIQRHFANGLPLVFLLCTGEFPSFEEGGILVRPEKVLFNTVAAVAEGLRIGVLTPSADQIPQSLARWRKVSDHVNTVAASPYVNGMEAVRAGAETLREWGAQITLLDCIGYNRAMQEAVREITDKPAILGRSIAARVVAELIG